MSEPGSRVSNAIWNHDQSVVLARASRLRLRNYRLSNPKCPPLEELTL
jgi:hypothetical protein